MSKIMASVGCHFDPWNLQPTTVCLHNAEIKKKKEIEKKTYFH